MLCGPVVADCRPLAQVSLNFHVACCTSCFKLFVALWPGHLLQWTTPYLDISSIFHVGCSSKWLPQSCKNGWPRHRCALWFIVQWISATPRIETWYPHTLTMNVMVKPWVAGAWFSGSFLFFFEGSSHKNGSVGFWTELIMETNVETLKKRDFWTSKSKSFWRKSRVFSWVVHMMCVKTGRLLFCFSRVTASMRWIIWFEKCESRKAWIFGDESWKNFAPQGKEKHWVLGCLRVLTDR